MCPTEGTRRTFLKTISSGTAFSLLSGGPLAAKPTICKPNIILFLVDDMGLMDTSVPMLTDENGRPKKHPLNNWYRTPNMEKLAQKGIRFSNFYAHSVCSPTRCSIMTGQNSARHGSTTWIRPSRNNKGKFGPPDWDWTGLTKEDLTLPKLLKQEGYRTIHVGKAHFGPKNHDGADPTNLGFDRNIGGTCAGRPPTYYGERNYGEGNLRAVPDLEEYHGTETYLTEALTRKANEAIGEAVEADKPFFLNMCHYAVHAPFNLDPRFAEHYKNSDKSKPSQAYATMIEGVDKSLGDIIANLEHLGVADNTLLIFFGDNGSDAPLGKKHGYTSSAPLLGKKGTHHEGGVRVPFIAAWAQPDPGNPWQKRLPIAAGEINSQIGTITDLLPTICSLVGVNIPDGYERDGFELQAQLAGRRNPQRSNTFLNHFPHNHRSSYYTLFIKDGWKVVYDYPVKGNPRYELYNLEKDPCEKCNLASDNPERLKAMLQAMKKDLQSKGALYPVKDGKALRPETP